MTDVLLAFDPGAGCEANAAAVGEAADALRVGGVAPAARDDAQGRFVDGAELLTCIAGDGPPLGRAAVEAHVPDGVEVEYHEGGQPAWWWLLCAE